MTWDTHIIILYCKTPHRKLGDGLFLQCCKEVAAGYPDIQFDSMIVDNTTMQVFFFLIEMHEFKNTWIPHGIKEQDKMANPN